MAVGVAVQFTRRNICACAQQTYSNSQKLIF